MRVCAQVSTEEERESVGRFYLDLVAIGFTKLIVARVPVSLFTETRFLFSNARNKHVVLQYISVRLLCRF